MTPARVIGVLLLVQMAVGPVVNFALLGPAMSAAPGFLQNAAGHATEVRLATLLALVGSACSVGIALAFLSVLPTHDRSLGSWILVLAVTGLCAAVLEGSALRAMLALSEEFVRTGSGDVAAFTPTAVALRAVRHAAHYALLLLAGAQLVLLYAGLWHLRLVPRVLAGAGVVAAMLLVGAAVGPLMGGHVVMLLLAPLGLCQFALAGWLMIRGFASVTRAQEVHA
ncbi:MAG TPA: DUF4386 family protein [Steroidobacteraceae bacterium]|nr:DUF4386 family protein [Steroidobacteraceae bacterium]